MLWLVLLGCPQTESKGGIADTGSDTPADTSASCGDCDGYTAAEGDCATEDPTINPGAEEICDGRDNDCNGEVDDVDRTTEGVTEYADDDGDGYGDPEEGVWSCEPDGWGVRNTLDCDDSDAEVNPSATEACNRTDDDCDGEVDEGLAVSTWYADRDRDGVGATADSVDACIEPSGCVATPGDCDDWDALRQFCGSCQEVLDAGIGTADGVYTLDPCGGAPGDYWCDLTTDGGGWTVAGWQAADARTSLGLSVRNGPGDPDFSVNLACVPYDEIAVFNSTFGEWEAESYPGDTWTATSTNLDIGDAGVAFAEGTYGPADSGMMMACVDYQYAGRIVAEYACDTDTGGGARGHITDYAGEYCGARLDYTWAWTDGVSCTHTGEAYTWGFAIRGYATSGNDDIAATRRRE